MDKTYLFDFDGTLVDSMPVYAKTMLKILDDNKISYDQDIVKKITPLGMRGTAEYFIKLGVNLTVEELLKCMSEGMIYEYSYNIDAKKNVIKTLKELKRRGLGLNVLTASPHITLDACLKRLKIFDLFDNVWSCDDFNTTKSDPKIYKMAAERIGKRVEEIIFIDDNFNADKTAKQAGMTVYGIYDESSNDYVEEIKSITDKYIYDFNELL